MSTQRSSGYRGCWIILKQFLPNKNSHISIIKSEGVEVDSAWLNGYEEMQHVEENDQTECQEKDQV